ncbi:MULTISPECIES: STAS domain-containing protein [Priestia]|uniref:STAS domain-containing protein n=1 Tax=Priestia TaxID=2800373 RepID=UPI0013FA4D80|nr:STAS domain-containing protein [Priestia megaterium]MBW0933600.1 STAS domain-containing protein [Priestia megaterium]MED4035783.1 STAS domain-containing protein [Priestia megaterium]NGY69652.1 STAS domain-containing protein [Priestia megaterium]NGY69757.1 STAS domain-containing protein [Priestia megaterium]
MQLKKNEYLQPIKESIIKRRKELVERKRQDFTNIHRTGTDLTAFRSNLLTVYADSIDLDKDSAAEVISEWGQDVSNLLVDLELPLEVALNEISFYRYTIGEIIREEADDKNFSLNAFYEIISHFNMIVDHSAQWLSKSYIQDYTNKIKHAQYAIDELSVPIVRMTEEIGILPLVGDLDTKRAQILMENALTKGSEYHLKLLIIDLSAVPIIDTMVADQVFKVIAALRLIGINVVLSGIRPEIAQTMVNLGIEMNSIKTFSSLHQAVTYTNSLIESAG